MSEIRRSYGYRFGLGLAAAAAGVLSFGAVRATCALPPGAASQPNDASIPETHPLVLTPAAPLDAVGAAVPDGTHSPTNSFVAAVDRGEGKTRETWIATRAGVKCVDRAHQQMRHYTRHDGLPSDDTVAIHADRDRVWCLAATPESTSFCTLDETTGRWRIRENVDSGNSPTSLENMGGWGSQDQRAVRQNARALIAASAHEVAFTTGAVGYKADTLAEILDKRTDKLTRIPWDAALRADNDVVGPTALAMPDDDTLWLGTSLGLLRWSQTAQRWRRYLPDRYIDAMALDGDKSVWVVAHSRSAKYGMNAGLPIWTLLRLSVADGHVQEWLPPANEIQALAGSTTVISGGTTFAFPPRGSAENLRDNLPVAVSIARDGAVWTSHVSRMGLEGGLSNFSSSLRQAGQHGGFERFDPKSEQWTAYPLRPVENPGKSHVAVGGTDDAGAIPLDQLTDAAVRPLATTLVPYSPYGSYNAGTNLYWVRRRYPEWLCLESIGSKVK